VNLLLNLIQRLTARIQREEGQTIVEYALVLGGVSLVLITALVTAGLGDEFSTLVDNIAEAMGTAL
jgi:Flp pilus assembly pilin Flp